MPVKAIVTHNQSKRKIVTFEFGIGTDGRPTEVSVDDETLRLPLPLKCVFKRWTINGVLPPTGADGTVDIFLDDVSILGTALVTFPDGSALPVLEGNTFSIVGGNKDARVYAKVITVGSSYAGKGWLVTLEIE